MVDVLPIAIAGGAIALVSSLSSKKKGNLPPEVDGAIRSRVTQMAPAIKGLTPEEKAALVKKEAARVLDAIGPIDLAQKIETQDALTESQRSALDRIKCGSKPDPIPPDPMRGQKIHLKMGQEYGFFCHSNGEWAWGTRMKV